MQLEIDRAEATIRAHDKSDDKFDETLIGLFDIASKAWDVFDNSEDIELKRLLMKFVFEKLNISNGTIYYKLRFPFSEMEFVSKLGLNEKDGQNPEKRIVAEPLINKASSDKISEFKISENNDFRTVKNDVKTKTCDIKSQVSPNWLPNSYTARTAEIVDFSIFYAKRKEIIALHDQLQVLKRALAA